MLNRFLLIVATGTEESKYVSQLKGRVYQHQQEIVSCKGQDSCYLMNQILQLQSPVIYNQMVYMVKLWLMRNNVKILVLLLQYLSRFCIEGNLRLFALLCSLLLLLCSQRGGLVGLKWKFSSILQGWAVIGFLGRILRCRCFTKLV